jgi:hypothetical protein
MLRTYSRMLAFDGEISAMGVFRQLEGKGTQFPGCRRLAQNAPHVLCSFGQHAPASYSTCPDRGEIAAHESP